MFTTVIYRRGKFDGVPNNFGKAFTTRERFKVSQVEFETVAECHNYRKNQSLDFPYDAEIIWTAEDGTKIKFFPEPHSSDGLAKLGIRGENVQTERKSLWKLGKAKNKKRVPAKRRRRRR